MAEEVTGQERITLLMIHDLSEEILLSFIDALKCPHQKPPSRCIKWINVRLEEF